LKIFARRCEDKNSWVLIIREDSTKIKHKLVDLLVIPIGDDLVDLRDLRGDHETAADGDSHRLAQRLRSERLDVLWHRRREHYHSTV
jgi:hypothetical protein